MAAASSITTKSACPILSASIGLSIAAAIQIGYSNIFVTAPSPDNLNTLF